MSEAHERLAQALEERILVISDRAWVQRDASGHLAALQQVSEKITRLAAELPPPVDPRLAHYLERCSFDKALAHLRGAPSEH